MLQESPRGVGLLVKAVMASVAGRGDITGFQSLPVRWLAPCVESLQML